MVDNSPKSTRIRARSNGSITRVRHSFVSLQPGVSVESAVQQLLDVTTAVASMTDFTDSEDLSNRYENVWHSLMEDAVANTAPSEQTPLVEFVQTLQRQKVINPVTGNQLCSKECYDSAVWTELPFFGINIRDEWKYGTRHICSL
jgi:hypothetical protein